MTQPLWTAEEAAKATGGEARGDWVVNGVSIDTREITDGDLFVALKDRRDGHEFVDQAFVNGATAALVSQDIGDKNALLVDNTLTALEDLGLAARARTGAVHTAVTGSVGKTSVKEMIAQIFRSAGPAHWNQRSFNNHWGVPLTLARMPRETKRAIFEIGMNTPGEIGPRSLMVRPQIAMVTKIAAAHLEGLGGVDAIADEKSRIFEGLDENGVAVLPRADDFFDYMKARVFDFHPRAQLVSFGDASSDADAKLLKFDNKGDKSIGRADILGEQVSFELNAVGAHWGLNAVLALLIGKLSGMTAGQAAEGLNGFTPPSGRGAAHVLKLPDGGDFTLLDDAYNANPESMRAALSAMSLRKGRKVIVFGEMLELGPDADKLHAELSAPIRENQTAELFLAGKGMKALASEFTGQKNEPGVCWASSADELLTNIKKALRSGDCVLIKGSNASGIARVGNALRQWSDEASGQSMVAVKPKEMGA